MFYASIVALVTPMQKNGDVDYVSLAKLIDYHVLADTNAIVIAGTTGEASNLSDDEFHELLTNAIKLANNRIPIIAGVGTNSTKSTIARAKIAAAVNADAVLVVTPYYVKPTQSGLLQHFRAVSEAITLPIILYNVPGRTGCDLLPATVEKLQKITNIIAIKEASGSIERYQALLDIRQPEFKIYSGDDNLALQAILMGLDGIISVTANVAAKYMAEMTRHALKKDEAEARKIDTKISKLHEALFLAANPIPVKYALHKMGMIDIGIRLPLDWLAEPQQLAVVQALNSANIKVST